MTLREADGPKPKALVLGVQLPGVSDAAFASSLEELGRLADTLGLQVIGRLTQKRTSLSAKGVVGEGKLKELVARTPGPAPEDQDDEEDEEEEPKPSEEEEEPADDDAFPIPESTQPEVATVVLVDHDLSPSQNRALEKLTGAQVYDRSMVILSIFQRHARTREARTQVEIARLVYLAPRLRGANAGRDRQRGGIGGKGAGESALELDRRRIRDRIAELKREMEIVKREADTQRSRRLTQETPTVALVGYTNAGKSSLMRAMTGDAVYVADQLFATLDTTVRALKPETKPRILVSDTVGFIKQLPHDLVASFRSTLLEAKDAGLLLHVVDASDPAFRDQHDVTREVLKDIGAQDNPTLLLLNKADRLSDEQRNTLQAEFPEAMLLSARSPEDIERLHAHIVAFFEKTMEETTFVIPYSEQRRVALLHERCRVLDERYEEDGTHLVVRAPASVIATLRAGS